MAIKEMVNGVVRRGTSLDKDVQERISRGRDRLSQIAPFRNEALEFWRGNQYFYVDQKGVLQWQVEGGTGIRGGGKPSWRVRESHNLLVDVVAHEVSAATSRVPSYEIVPATGEPEDQSAAKVAQQVAIYGYDKWNIRDATVKAVTHAIVADEAFAWVYWDSSIGPFIKGSNVGLGDVCVEIYSGNQVYWEPGQRFEKSDWHAIDIAMTEDAVKRLDGYNGTPVTPDADAISQVGKGQNAAQRKMVLVTYYLERPTPENPKGRWLTTADGKEICGSRDYPSDDLCLHKLSYIVDPDSDRDMGLVRHLLTAQRTYNDAQNKIAEWKNLHLMGGRVFVTPGLLRQRITDEPGAVYQIPQPNENVKIWDAPRVPQELFQIAQDAQGEIARIAAQNDIPSQVEAGKAIQALIERDQSRRQSFLANLAEFHSRVMRSCLREWQKYATEDRTLYIKGDFGWDSVEDFQGAKLPDQVDVRVFPSSIEPLTRQNVEQRVIAFADRGWVSPEEAMHAIDAGTAQGLLDRVERAEARVQRVIRRIKKGPQALVQMGYRVAPPGFELPPGQALPPDAPPGTVPGWLPLPWDNIRVWRSVMEDWFQTEEAELLDLETQAFANAIYSAVLAIQAQQEMQAQLAAMASAEQQGMGNAARPQGPTPSPDQPALGQGPIQTPNQPSGQNGP